MGKEPGGLPALPPLPPLCRQGVSLRRGGGQDLPEVEYSTERPMKEKQRRKYIKTLRTKT